MFDSLSHDGVKRPGAREMTVMLAGLMALNAFAIDAMVPALPAIGRSLHVALENHRQLVVVAYFVGFASTQLFWGPLADRFGRKIMVERSLVSFVLVMGATVTTTGSAQGCGRHCRSRRGSAM